MVSKLLFLLFHLISCSNLNYLNKCKDNSFITFIIPSSGQRKTLEKSIKSLILLNNCE